MAEGFLKQAHGAFVGILSQPSPGSCPAVSIGDEGAFMVWGALESLELRQLPSAAA
jgi:hypothetical protein